MAAAKHAGCVKATIVPCCPWINCGLETGHGPPQFIALFEASGASPQTALRGMAAMLCGLRYDEDVRLVPLDSAAA